MRATELLRRLLARLRPPTVGAAASAALAAVAASRHEQRGVIDPPIAEALDRAAERLEIVRDLARERGI